MKIKIYAVCFLALCFLFTQTACGKKGAPLPQESDRYFAFQNISLQVNSVGALTVMGTVTGNIKNIQGITFEIEAFDETCPTCPFVPTQSVVLNARNIINGNGDFSETVFPAQKADGYRWRLVGHNLYAGVPDVRSPVGMLEVNPLED